MYTLQICEDHNKFSTPQEFESVATGTAAEIIARYEQFSQMRRNQCAFRVLCDDGELIDIQSFLYAHC